MSTLRLRAIHPCNDLNGEGAEWLKERDSSPNLLLRSIVIQREDQKDRQHSCDHHAIVVVTALGIIHVRFRTSNRSAASRIDF